MTFTSRERPGVFPGPRVLLTLAERDPDCSCTWVVAVYRKCGKDGDSLFELKCRDSLCKAGVFHRRLARGAGS